MWVEISNINFELEKKKDTKQKTILTNSIQCFNTDKTGAIKFIRMLSPLKVRIS